MLKLEQPQDEEGYKAKNKKNRNKPSRTIPHWQDSVAEWSMALVLGTSLSGGKGSNPFTVMSTK